MTLVKFDKHSHKLSEYVQRITFSERPYDVICT